MSEPIEIEVGTLHAQLHDQLEGVQDGYDERIRDLIEDFIHDEYQEVERRQEEQNHIIQKSAESNDE